MAPSQNENRPYGPYFSPEEIKESTSMWEILPDDSEPPIKTPSSRYGAKSPTSRAEHFTIGINENLPENVISMKDFKNKKMLRKPMGY
jgi:hypothetical protein